MYGNDLHRNVLLINGFQVFDGQDVVWRMQEPVGILSAGQLLPGEEACLREACPFFQKRPDQAFEA
jgi:hypothetical protein